MRKKTLLFLGLPFLVGFVGCTPADDDEGTGNPWDDTSTETGTGVGDANYHCVPEEVDTKDCGEYPAHEEGLWDLGSVIPNTTFGAYYDRDCDGEPEETTMRMYEDVYCQRDKIKSLVLAVGSNCGSDTGVD